MIQATIGFVVFGVHKDGLKDPMGTPFIDDALVQRAKSALVAAGLKVIEYGVVVASKEEARAAFKKMKSDDAIDAVVLFSGTWVWAAHMVGAIRDYCASGKGLLLWTHPGSQGWRPVGGLVLHGGLLEIGVPHKFLYGSLEEPDTVSKIVSYAQASYLKNFLNMSTIGTFGGRGMGQTCGTADPSQWMRMFGIDIDSRDTTELKQTAEGISSSELDQLQPRLKQLFGKEPERNAVTERSMRLYLALRKVVAREKFDFYTIQSFPGLAGDYSATCFAQSMMLEDGVGTSTLGDFNTALTVLLLTKLSKRRECITVICSTLTKKQKKSRVTSGMAMACLHPRLASEPLGLAGFSNTVSHRKASRRPVLSSPANWRRSTWPTGSGPDSEMVNVSNGHYSRAGPFFEPARIR